MFEQTVMHGTGWIAIEHAVDSHAAAIKDEIAHMVRDAIEFINRSTGQHLYHLRMRNADALRRLVAEAI